MKKLLYFLFLPLFLSILFSCNSKHAGIIENPGYEGKTTGIYTIQQIAFTDTTTRVTILSEFIPNWWVNYDKDDSLTDVETGESFLPIAIEGAEFGAKLWMPEDGDSVVTLIYPRIPDHIAKVDWCEGIFGISLNPKDAGNVPRQSIPKSAQKWINNELNKGSKKPIKNFESDDFFSSEPARIVGYIKGYDKKYNLKTGIIYMENQFTNEDYPVVVNIHPDGRFEADLPMLHPIHSALTIQNNWIPFYIEPGHTLAIILDWNDFLLADRYRNRLYMFEMTTFQGKLANINNDLKNFKPNEFNYEEFKKKVNTLSPGEFITEHKNFYTNNIALLDKYLAENTISKKAETILRNELTLSYGKQFFNYVSDRKYAAQQNKENEILALPIPDDYYNFLHEIPLNSKNLVISSDYSSFVNRYEFSKVLAKSMHLSYTEPEITFYDYLLATKVEIPDNELRIFKALFSKNKTEEDKKLLNDNKSIFSDLIQKHWIKLYNYYKEDPHRQTFAIKGIANWEYKDSVLINRLKLENNLTHEIAKIRSLGFIFDNSPNVQCLVHWSILKSTITEPFLVQTGDDLFSRSFPDEYIAAYELPDEKGTEILKEIIDPFKGKIVFVDFWATTCGPCVAGIKRMKENREKHADNPDFDFIFITDERSSPKTSYDSFVAEQDLKNTYRLSMDEYNYLRQLFKFNGIPRYVVIDKEGKVLNDDFSMYKFESELPKILEIAK